MSTIITNKNMLTQECQPVASFEEAMSIVDILNKTLDAEKTGIGLAANQIGINKKVFIVSIPQNYLDPTDPSEYKITVHFANPEIISLTEPIIFPKEGCLSFPGEQYETIRYNKVVIKDLLAPEGREFSGLTAVVVQHECDHVFGIIMSQRKRNAIGANDLCPCQSGKKFKKCCFKNLKKAAF